jgi:hypothetical protein
MSGIGYELAVGTWTVDDLASARRYCKATKATGLSATYKRRERTWTGRDGFTFARTEYVVEVTP